MTEADSAGDTIVVLTGRVLLTADSAGVEGRTGELLAIPPERHSVKSLGFTVVLLTATTPRAVTPSSRAAALLLGIP